MGGDSLGESQPPAVDDLTSPWKVGVGLSFWQTLNQNNLFFPFFCKWVCNYQPFFHVFPGRTEDLSSQNGNNAGPTVPDLGISLAPLRKKWREQQPNDLITFGVRTNLDNNCATAVPWVELDCLGTDCFNSGYSTWQSNTPFPTQYAGVNVYKGNSSINLIYTI